MSQLVAANGCAYISGQVADDRNGSLEEQATNILANIEKLLAKVGSDKSKLLKVDVYLAAIVDFSAFNAVYDDWIDPRNPPARVCSEARLADPRIKVEIAAVALL
jgi:enamine deaminase RidA (YjgF/YER057c/UK114 family)